MTVPELWHCLRLHKLLRRTRPGARYCLYGMPEERVFVIGAGRISTELDSIVQHVNSSRISMELDYTFDAPNDPNQFYYRSDHYMYAQYGIPIAFFFTDVHEDYHRPTDTYDKINYRKLERIARLAYYIGYEIAEKNELLKLDADPDVKKGENFIPIRENGNRSPFRLISNFILL